MALTRQDKENLVEVYKKNLEGLKNLIIVKHFGLPVNEVNKVRMDIAENGGKMQVIKKRIFLKQVEELGYEGSELSKLEDSVFALYAYEEEFAPLKVLEKYKKQWKKEKKEYGFDYLGGWFEKIWQEKDFVSDLAIMPSKEELIGKFAFLMNYPVQSFVQVLDQIAQKGGESVDTPAEEIKEETKEEVKTEEKVEEPKVEEKKEEIKEDTATSEEEIKE